MITAFINKRGENNLPSVFPGRSGAGPNQTHREPLINAQMSGCLSEDGGILFHFQLQIRSAMPTPTHTISRKINNHSAGPQ
jgi:hypothetical protein